MVVKGCCKNILEALSTPKSISELKAITGIPDRTLRYKLVKLKNQGLVKEIAVLSDMRKKLFVLGGD